MCLIFLACDTHPRYSLILAANRDEFYDRPTAPLDFLEDQPGVLAGRDLKGGGTWLGIAKNGRIAAITNFREPANRKPDAPSRGDLVLGFLTGNSTPQAWLDRIQKTAGQYNGFNLLVGDLDGLFYFTNRKTGIKKLTPGLYGVSNRFLDTPWPKVTKGKHQLKTVFEKQEIDAGTLFRILRNTTRPPDSDLPDTGVGLEFERMLSSIFVTSEVYGTRSSSILLVHRDGKVEFMERTFVPGKDWIVEGDTRRFEFRIEAGAPRG